MADPILVTGAGGGVGRTVVQLLREREEPVRALVHREDERAEALRALGAEVVAGDLTRPSDVADAMDGCARVLFCLSVTPGFLEAAATVATVAESLGGLAVLVDLSQMTVSSMTAVSVGESHQQRLHWLSEQVFDWSGLPIVHLRPTVFLDNALFTTLVARPVAERGVLALPFGTGRTSPIASADVAHVAAAVLREPAPHIGSVLELTGARTEDMHGVAEEYSRALGRRIAYEDAPAAEWNDTVLADAPLTPHVRAHLETLVRLHREHRFDRTTKTVEAVLGRPPQTIEAFVAERAALFS
jgi:uncharacterized protein YbjT (DUF2867 family)